MPKKPVQKGGQYFEYRNGLGGFSWEGMATKVDPGGNPPNRPRYLGNTRIQGGVITAHPQYTGFGTMVPQARELNPLVQNSSNRPPLGVKSVAKWLKHWVGEHNSVGGTRLWWGGYPPLSYGGIPPDWIVDNTGAFLGFLDTDSDPVFNNVAYYPAGDTWTPSVERFNREVYIGDYGKLRKIQLIQPPAGAEPADILSAPADESIASFPGFRCAVLQEYNGKLYFMLTDPFTLGNGEIWSWDGFQVVQEYVMGSPGAAGAAGALYKNQLVFSVAGYGSIIYYDPASGWGTATVGGFDSSPFQNSMAQYRDKLYIMDGVDKIYSWDGSALTLAHTISATAVEMGRPGGNPAIPALAFCCTTLIDRLYYFWTDLELTPNQICLGCLDDKTDPTYQWIDTYQHNIWVTDLGGYPSEGGNGCCTALAQYRGRLWAAFGNFPTGNSEIWTHHAQFTPYDGWHLCGGEFGPGQSFGTGAFGKVPIYFFRSI
jgi:hypothetical protein